MSGSSLAPVIIPIVVVPVLAIWLIMVSYADSHPLWRARTQAPAERGSSPLAAGESQDRVPAVDTVILAVPGPRAAGVPGIVGPSEDRSPATGGSLDQG